MNQRQNQAGRGKLNGTERRSSVPNDLPDSRTDDEKLQSEETYIDLPDVKDIPGQEFVNAPPPGIMADATAASDDEEGRRVFDEEEETAGRSGNDFDVRTSERRALENADRMPTTDNENLRRASLDNTDFDGERLNERGFGEETSGSDLDMPDSTDETETDPREESDEENQHYSLGSGANDNVVEGTP